MRTPHLLAALLAGSLLLGCGGSDAPPFTLPPPNVSPVVVNTLSDALEPPAGKVTLRMALGAAESGQPITFDPSLDGGEIQLLHVGDAHSTLKAEVMGIRDEPSGPVSYLVGYFDRDYGRSALYAQKNVVIDASDLPAGITIAWRGDEDARVLAVYGNLTMTGVTVTGGRSVTEDISTDDPTAQPWTLARGGAVAVWGRARLNGCTLYDNHCVGDFDSSRDRGAFGGGLYANIVELTDCIVGGNTVLGAGAAGGGVFSVGGANTSSSLSTLERCTISGNRIAGLFAYGAGVYSDGGGIGNRKTLELRDCTVARNVSEPAPGLPPFLLGMGYWRGGGLYMSNGYMHLWGCTVVENESFGYARTDSLSRPNLAGGIAATIGNAHAVEDLVIGFSIVAGNQVHELGMDGLPAKTYDHDVFTGSLLYFKSRGHNRFGVLDFSQILVPVGWERWETLSRKHYPKVGDLDGLELGDVLDLDLGITHHASMLSAGVDPGTPLVLNYQPQGPAVDALPAATYVVYELLAEYSLDKEATDDFLAIVLERLEAHYGLPGFAATRQAEFEGFLQAVDLDDETPGLQPYLDPGGDPILTLADTHFFGPAETWPKELANHPYIHFWHQLDGALMAHDLPGMGPELLGDSDWASLFAPGPLDENPGITMMMEVRPGGGATPSTIDQVGTARPTGAAVDIGAIEKP